VPVRYARVVEMFAAPAFIAFYSELLFASLRGRAVIRQVSQIFWCALRASATP